MATNDPTAAGDGAYVVDRDEPGCRLPTGAGAGLVERLGTDAVAVMGEGALPLLTQEDFAAVREAVRGGGDLAVTNNFYSADLTAWTPAGALAPVGAFARDNVLPGGCGTRRGAR